MKKVAFGLLSALAVVVLLSSCGSSGDSGQLEGVSDRPGWNSVNPYGMVYVPSGVLHVGQSDQDIFASHLQHPRTISIQGFFMDETEITNNEYRQFVYYVKDSIAHTYLDHFYEDEMGEEHIDWEYEIDWADESLEDLYFQGDDVFNGKTHEVDPRLLVYEYQNTDWKMAASRSFDGARGDIITDVETEIYPDTLVWIRDFAYSYNEPFTRNYFWHPAFDDYPVVGVNWKMAQAFTHWRTLLWDYYRQDEPNTEKFRLPTEHEWEYAARGGKDLAPFPWGAYYARNAKGCLLANFKPGRGNYPEDGGMFTVKGDAYFPNDYGLYCMAGNVAEWTETAFFESSQSYFHDLNPDIKYDAADDDPEVFKRKVIRGGSWKDVLYYLQTGTRSWEYQDTTKSYVGFRCALTYLGRSLNDFQ